MITRVSPKRWENACWRLIVILSFHLVTHWVGVFLFIHSFTVWFVKPKIPARTPLLNSATMVWSSRSSRPNHSNKRFYLFIFVTTTSIRSNACWECTNSRNYMAHGCRGHLNTHSFTEITPNGPNTWTASELRRRTLQRNEFPWRLYGEVLPTKTKRFSDHLVFVFVAPCVYESGRKNRCCTTFETESRSSFWKQRTWCQTTAGGDE